jgi:lysophospholipase L1-like esterase
MRPRRRLAVLVTLGLAAALAAGELLARRADERVPAVFEASGEGRVRRSPAWGKLSDFDVTLVPDRPRIVWMGASTIAGVPYEAYVAPPAWLEYVLAWRGADVEVVPMARAGLTAEDLARLLPYALELSPTAVVVTTGHNEYLHANLRVDPPWWLSVRLLVRARGLLGLPMAPAPRMPSPEHDFDHRAIVAAFRGRLEELQARAEAASVPLLFTTPVSNMLDIAPVLGDDERLPEGPDAAHARGLALLAAGDTTGAREALHAARDRDRWPHRATGPLMQAVAGTARLLVDVEAAFDAAALKGIPGFDLFADHCHPNPTGQLLMAGCVADALEDAGILPPTGQRGELPDLAAGLVHFGLDAEAGAWIQARLARTYVGIELMRGRPGHLTAIARRMLEQLVQDGAQDALRGHVEASLGLAAMLAGDAAAARAHIARAREASPEAAADLERLNNLYPWVSRLVDRHALTLEDATTEGASAPGP